MANTVFLYLNYDADPPVNQKVRDNVDKVFAKCFGELKQDVVAIKWTKGVDKKKQKQKNEFNISSDGHFVNKAVGSTGDGNVTIDKDGIGNACALESDADPDVATANVIAHEVGHHGICGNNCDPKGDKKADNVVDKMGLTKATRKDLGVWSADVCKCMKEKLGVK
jgi:hypothetical protein